MTAAAKEKRRPVAILERVLDDDFVHEQLGVAAAGLRDTYRRARRLPPDVAVRDQTVYDHVRTTATGFTKAIKRAATPPPEPPRRRRGPLLLVMAVAAAVVLRAAKRDRERRGSRAPGPPEPSAA